MKFFTYTVVIFLLFLYQVYTEAGMLSAKHSSLTFLHDIAHFSRKSFFHIGQAKIKNDVLIIKNKGK